MSNFNVQQIKPAILKAKEVATLNDVDVVDSKVTNVTTEVQSIGTVVNGIVNGTVDLSNAKVGTTNLITYVQNEVDKKINVYSGTDVATFTGTPATNDLYIEKKTLTSSTGIPVDVVNTYRYDGTNWVRIGNDNNILALADMVDGKRSVYTGTPSGTFRIGDLWIKDTTEGTRIYVYNGIDNNSVFNLNDWIPSDTLLENFISTTFSPTVDNLQQQIDNKVEYWFQSYDPSLTWTVSDKPKHVGDVWYNTSTQKSYYFNASYQWTIIEDSTAIAALNQAALAQDTADGKRTVFTSSSAPIPPYDQGDLWINGTTIQVATVTRTTGTATVSDWAPAGNYTTSTSQLTDDANLGSTAVWSNVTGVGKPQDNADVTLNHFGGNGKNILSNYFVTTLSDIFTPTLSNTSSYYKQETAMYGSYPALKMILDKYTVPLTVTVTSTVGVSLEAGKEYFISAHVSASSLVGDVRFELIDANNTVIQSMAMVNRVFNTLPVVTVSTSGVYRYRFVINKTGNTTSTSSTLTGTTTYYYNPIIYLYRFMVEEKIGNQTVPSDYASPQTASTAADLNNSVHVNNGGIVLSNGGAIRNVDVDLATNNGIFLGHSGYTYQFLAGNGTNYVRWNGSSLSIAGALKAGEIEGNVKFLGNIGKIAAPTTPNNTGALYTSVVFHQSIQNSSSGTIYGLILYGNNSLAGQHNITRVVDAYSNIVYDITFLFSDSTDKFLKTTVYVSDTTFTNKIPINVRGLGTTSVLTSTDTRLVTSTGRVCISVLKSDLTAAGVDVDSSAYLNGFYILIDYQIVDQNGNPITTSTVKYITGSGLIRNGLRG